MEQFMPLLGGILVALVVGTIGYLFWSKQKGNRGRIIGADGRVFDNIIEMNIDMHLKPWIDESKAKLEEAIDSNVTSVLVELRADMEPMIEKIMAEMNATRDVVSKMVKARIEELEALAIKITTKK